METTQELPAFPCVPIIPWFARVRVSEAAIVSIHQRVMDIIDPPAMPEPPKKGIGFQIRESKAQYVLRRRTG